MTITIPTLTTASSTLSTDHHVQDGVAGYLVKLGAETAFIPEADGDRLARFMLFDKPDEGTGTDTPPVTPPAIVPAKPEEIVQTTRCVTCGQPVRTVITKTALLAEAVKADAEATLTVTKS